MKTVAKIPKTPKYIKKSALKQKQLKDDKRVIYAFEFALIALETHFRIEI